MNKLCTVLLLRAPTCRASVGSIFAKIWPGSPFTATHGLGHICGIMHVISHCTLLRGLITIFSGYIVIQCL